MIDLNVDIGEGFPFDEELMNLATSVNICAGVHAGSKEVALETMLLARDRGLRVGGHPGFPDRANMGRVEPNGEQLTSWLESVTDQINWLVRHRVEYVKPHGAFYNLASRGESACLSLLVKSKVRVMMLAGSPGLASLPHNISEVFADRSLDEKGMLMSRTVPGAVLASPVEAAERALTLARRVDSICVHGDTSGCVAILAAVREALLKEGFSLGWI